MFIFLRIVSRPISNIEFNANFWEAVLKIGFSKDKIAWGAWIVRREIFLPQCGKLLAIYLLGPLRHFIKGLFALTLVKAIAGTDESKFGSIDATIVGCVFQVKHKVHVSEREKETEKNRDMNVKLLVNSFIYEQSKKM